LMPHCLQSARFFEDADVPPIIRKEGGRGDHEDAQRPWGCHLPDKSEVTRNPQSVIREKRSTDT
jgi:hypothetical protein